MKIKVDIISGFLGAGKTIFIKKLISEGLKEEKIVVIENEFGKVSIDGEILKESSIKVKEISSGCICCSPLLDFMKTLTETAEEFRPSRIIVEPTGVALLSEVISQFTNKRYEDLIELNMIVTIVDAKKYNSYMKLRPEFFVNQIRTTKNIVVSKVDSMNEAQLQEVIEAVKTINPTVNIIASSWHSLNTLELISALEDPPFSLLKSRLKKAVGVKNTAIKHIESANEAFSSFELELDLAFTEENLLTLLEKIKEIDKYGTVLRGKGIVANKSGGKFKFDYVAGDITIESFPSQVQSRICFIGIDLNKKALATLLQN